MEICGHYIKRSSVIGIGPLMRQKINDNTDYTLYGTVRYSFILHLQNCSVDLQSDWFRPKEAQDLERKKQIQLMENYRQYYEDAKQRILSIIKNEDDEKEPV